MKRLAGVVNVKTGENHVAPTYCPFCGRALGEMIRHLLAASFEATCEHDDCGKTFIVMDDHSRLTGGR